MARQKHRPQPELIKVNETWFKLCVFLIHSKNEDGSPGLCKLIPDDKTIDLAGGGEFMTAYIPRHMLDGKNDGSSTQPTYP